MGGLDFTEYTSFSRSLQCIIAIVVDRDIILQKISSHYVTWVNYKSYVSVIHFEE